MNVSTVYSANDTLGEGPVWNSKDQSIYWVDIINQRLQALSVESGKYRTWSLPSQIGSYALREQGGAIVALETGFAFLDFDSNKISPICDPEIELKNNRFNDGKCDRQGRFWAGTMADGSEAVGSLYRLDKNLNCNTMRTGVKISNGLGWSPDNKTMYYTDSPLKTIFTFDYDEATGDLSNERIFAQIDQGVPDGLTVDAEGNVWSAIWDGWRVMCFAPDGSVKHEVKMPVQRPTSCIFGGKNLDELYVTSAQLALSQEELEKQPLAGSLFKLKPNTKGLPEPKFAA